MPRPRTLALALLLVLLFGRTSANLFGADTCRNEACATCAQVAVSGSCASFRTPATPLTDRRFKTSLASQCRARCNTFVREEFLASRVVSNCTLCQTERAHEQYALYDDDDEVRNPHYCIPRQICIAQCGPELPGCVYSGTCASQICYEGRSSGKKAVRKRVTFGGPGTVLLVDNNPGPPADPISSYPKGPNQLPTVILSGEDSCASRGARYALAGFCSDSNIPFVDATDEPNVGVDNAQCRVLCDIWVRQDYEVVRRNTDCGFCNTPAADKYTNKPNGFSTICVPRAMCVEQCGSEPAGCMYSGSCQSLLCFSGIDSKKPATITLKSDDGDDGTISVDNSGDIVDSDPPIFASGFPSPTPSPSKGFVPPSPLPSPTSAGTLQARDFCRKRTISLGVDIPVSGTCNFLTTLTDRRFTFPGAEQCRAHCSKFEQFGYRAYRIATNCTFCRTEIAHDSYALYEESTNNADPQYCIPREICVGKCGPERPGCVYTGTCASQICFEGSLSRKAAVKKRVTFDGPGTIMLVDNTPGTSNGTLISTSQRDPTALPDAATVGSDSCATRGVSFAISGSSCGFSGRNPLSDERLSGISDEQCRAVCRSWKRDGYEVVRLQTKCSFCNSNKSDEFVTPKGRDSHICVPRSVCERECGAEPAGCVYTGTCRSLICFSGIDSKRAAVLTLSNDTGTASQIRVNNSGPAVGIDPPVFQTTLPSPSPSPSKRPQSPSVSPGPVGSQGSLTTSDSSTSLWAWLGPVVGLLAFVTVAIVAVVVIRAKTKGSAELPVEI